MPLLFCGKKEGTLRICGMFLEAVNIYRSKSVEIDLYEEAVVCRSGKGGLWAGWFGYW